jgi:hypothetical protein
MGKLLKMTKENLDLSKNFHQMFKRILKVPRLEFEIRKNNKLKTRKVQSLKTVLFRKIIQFRHFRKRTSLNRKKRNRVKLNRKPEKKDTSNLYQS